MRKISLFNFDGEEFNVLHDRGSLAYTFEIDGRTFGNKVKIESKSIKDVSDAAFALALNAFETLQAVRKLQDANTNTSGENKGTVAGLLNSSESESAGIE
jgi:hypothetical protein